MSIKKSLFLGYLVLFVLPLVCIVYYTFNLNREFALGTIEGTFESGLKQTVTSISEPLEISQGLMRVVSEVAANSQKMVRLEGFNFILKSALSSNKHLDAIYVSLEDGYHRVVTRVDAYRRNSDKGMPAKAEWTSSVIEPFAVAGIYRKRKIKYYAQWPLVISRGEQETNKLDIRALDHYVTAKEKQKLYIGPIVVNSHTGNKVISIGVPIMVDGKFTGMVGANININYIENTLNNSKITENAIVSIVNTRGEVILHSRDIQKEYAKDEEGNTAEIYNDKLALQKAYLSGIMKEGSRGDNRLVKFYSEERGLGYLQRVMLPASVGKGLELVMVAPYQDFVSKVVQTSVATIWFSLALCFAVFLAIFYYGSWFSVKIKKVVVALHDVHNHAVKLEHANTPIIREVAAFQEAVSDLDRKLTDLYHHSDASMQNKCVVCGANRFDINKN
ncbi:cache domain-containing protein [Rhodospirillaceae bacterium]|nr:cache domain-containing protein [Rhodospirillaceae bacterium]